MINNKIKQLTKIFLIDYYQNLNIINKNTKKINKKNIIVWLVGILIMCMTYLSFKAINFLIRTGEPIVFLKIYLPIIATIVIFELILLTCNIFYYSKDLKDILPLPIKPVEILIAKLNTLIIIMYFIEAVLLLIPLIMYGILVQKTIMFFIFSIIALATFPVLYILIIGLIMLFLMKLTKIIKNRNIFQILVTGILTFAVIFILIKNIGLVFDGNNIQEVTQIKIISEKITEINKIFIITNPIIKILTSDNFFEITKNLIILFFINLFALIVFILVGKKLYLNNILKNINNIENKNKKINKKIKYKIKNKKISYLNNEIKNIIKNPIFFIQYIMQYIFIIIIFCILLNYFLPVIMEQFENQNIIEENKIEEFKLQATLIVGAVIQIIFTFSNLSITAISRQGKNAVFMKYIPTSLKTQITLKAIPQIVINTFAILAVLIVIFLNSLYIEIKYYLIAFILGMILNLINSYLMILIDLKKPNLNWTNEESVSKDNENKIYKYIITILIFFILTYFSKVFKGFNFVNSIIIINIILIIFIIILKIYINKNIIKLMKKIY